jgi:hypothetical protein
MRAKRSLFVLAAAPFLCAPALRAQQAPAAAQEISLPGGANGIGFDDLRYSASLDRILAPAGGTGSLDLIDPATRAVTRISGFSKASRGSGRHGEGTTSADEGAGYLFATDRTSRTVRVVDPKEGKIVASTPLASGPDYVRFVGATRELWVTEPGADRIEVFRLEGDRPPVPQHEGFLPVPGGPESLVIDGGRGRAYANLWGGTTLAIDLRSRAIVERWPNGCQGSRGLALDAARGILFVACSEGKAVALDTARGGKELGAASSGSGVDIIDYDPTLGHLYFPGARSATMAVIGVGKGGSLSVLGTFPTAPGAHCVVSDRRGTAYVCDPRGGSLLAIRDPFPEIPR